VAEPSGSPPGPPHAARTTQAGEDTPRQRSNRRACCLRDVICNEAVPFRPYCGGVVSAQRIFVPGDLNLRLLTLTFQFFRAKDQTRLPCEFDANPGSAVPAIHCPIPVPRIERVSPISPNWHINGRQTITVNSGVSGPKFTKFLHDVDRTSALLTCPSAFPSYHPLWNASPKKEGDFADFAPKIGCHGNVLDRSGNQYQNEHLHQHVYHP